jgi:copper chaperone NosL
MKQLLLSLSLPFILMACTPEPQPITYGTDKCEFCRMTIVDMQHAAEVVTAKGRAYKFDAIECQIQYLQENKATEFAFILVSDYSKTTGELTPAAACTFLISPNISSPMGANLSAFMDATTAQEFQQTKDGQLYTWEEVQDQLKR